METFLDTGEVESLTGRSVILATVLLPYQQFCLSPVCASVSPCVAAASGRTAEASQEGGEEPVSERLSLWERRGLVGTLKVRNHVRTDRVAPWRACKVRHEPHVRH